MATKNYSEKVVAAKIMIDALNNNKENLPAGVSEETISKLKELKENSEKLNSEQEKLKALLKSKTAELDKNLKELSTLYITLKKRIKLDISKSLWNEYGFNDKK
ncbi:membrane-binding protein [Capnocytophaga sp.]|uniref:membrane-binding protein n=1 Tax=Capnocytophaga sp. TaxID=44737 RepID=UPI0026DCC24B|nr:membrane-binding protein [Capnocytophaga sp.]MDO5105313.1 membrane-binding protein [Capnocytophaga sp.]